MGNVELRERQRELIEMIYKLKRKNLNKKRKS